MSDLGGKHVRGRTSALIDVTNNTISVIQAIWPGLVTTVVGALIALVNSAHVSRQVALFVLGATIIVAGLFWGINRFTVFSKRRSPDLNPDWIILSDKRLAVIHSATRIDYRYEFKLRSRRSSVDTFRQKIGWTGVGPMTVSSVSSGFSHAFEATDGNYKIIRFFRNGGTAKGQDVNLSFCISTDGNVVPQQSFFAIDVNHHRMRGNDNTLSVKFDGSLIPTKVIARIYNEVGERISEDDSFDINTSKMISIKVDNRVGKRYVILWEQEQKEA